MAAETVAGQETAVKRSETRIFSGRRKRILRENLTAYLFLTPALLVILTFGIFPIMQLMSVCTNGASCKTNGVFCTSSPISHRQWPRRASSTPCSACIQTSSPIR